MPTEAAGRVPTKGMSRHTLGGKWYASRPQRGIRSEAKFTRSDAQVHTQKQSRHTYILETVTHQAKKEKGNGHLDPHQEAERIIYTERAQAYTARKSREVDSQETTAHREDGHGHRRDRHTCKGDR